MKRNAKKRSGKCECKQKIFNISRSQHNRFSVKNIKVYIYTYTHTLHIYGAKSFRGFLNRDMENI